MDYIKGNKEAWEEAFDHRLPNWGDDNHRRLKGERLPFFNEDMARQLSSMDFTGTSVAQFCCNNGRELLSLMQLGPARGVGFDIAENILGQARDTAQKAGIDNCDFIACNILDIGDEYHASFDLIMFTIGAITWFQDLAELFGIATRCLKPGGIILINDFHPMMNMLPMPGEPEYDEGDVNRLTYPYFRAEPWVETDGMGYMSGQYESKRFISFSHTLSDIINALIDSCMRIKRLNEYDYDVGLAGEGLAEAYEQG